MDSGHRALDTGGRLVAVAGLIAMLAVPIAAPAAADESLGRKLVESDAVLRRVGRGPVESLGIAGLTWSTVDPIHVTIRLRPAREGLLLRVLPGDTWPDLTDTLALAGAAVSVSPVPWIDLPVANRAAAGVVVVLSDAAGHVVFRITGSAVGASAAGTTVELAGRVRR